MQGREKRQAAPRGFPRLGEHPVEALDHAPGFGLVVVASGVGLQRLGGLGDVPEDGGHGVGLPPGVDGQALDGQGQDAERRPGLAGMRGLDARVDGDQFDFRADFLDGLDGAAHARNGAGHGIHDAAQGLALGGEIAELGLDRSDAGLDARQRIVRSRVADDAGDGRADLADAGGQRRQRSAQVFGGFGKMAIRALQLGVLQGEHVGHEGGQFRDLLAGGVLRVVVEHLRHFGQGMLGVFDLLADDVVGLQGAHGLADVGADDFGVSRQFARQVGRACGHGGKPGNVGRELPGNEVEALFLAADDALGALPGRGHVAAQGFDLGGNAGAVVHDEVGEFLHVVGQGGKAAAVGTQAGAFDACGDAEHGEVLDDLGEGRNHAGQLFDDAGHGVDVAQAFLAGRGRFAAGEPGQFPGEAFQGHVHALARGACRQFAGILGNGLAGTLQGHEALTQGEKILFAAVHDRGQAVFHAAERPAAFPQRRIRSVRLLGALGHAASHPCRAMRGAYPKRSARPRPVSSPRRHVGSMVKLHFFPLKTKVFLLCGATGKSARIRSMENQRRRRRLSSQNPATTTAARPRTSISALWTLSITRVRTFSSRLPKA